MVGICVLATFVDCEVGEVVGDESFDLFEVAWPRSHGEVDENNVVCEG